MNVRLREAFLNLFFVFYLILPEYFAVELSSSIPLITVSRLILLLLALLLLQKEFVSFRVYFPFVLYAAIIISVNIYHLLETTETVKAIISIVLEEFLVFVLVNNLLQSARELIKGLDLIVKVSGIICILAVFEVLTGFQMFHLLNTVNRDMLQTSYERLGFLRAESAFGHPVYFAIYCVCIFPFALYFYENTHKKIYLGIAILNVIGVFCSGSRGGIVTFAVLVLFMLASKKDSIKIEYLKKILMLIPLFVAVCLVSPQIMEKITGLVKSIFAAFGAGYNVEGFGQNALGMRSRTMQFTGLLWQKEHGALLMGFGPKSHTRGLISFINPVSGNWNVSTSIDIGYLAYIFHYGIVGTIGYFIFYYFLFRKCVKRSGERQRENLFNAFKYFYIAYFVSLMTSTGLSSLFFVITAMMLRYDKLRSEEQMS